MLSDVRVSVTVGPMIVSAASDETVTEGQSVTLHCQTAAIPAVAIVWRHNARPIHDSEHTQITGTATTTTVLRPFVRDYPGESVPEG